MERSRAGGSERKVVRLRAVGMRLGGVYERSVGV